MGSWHRWVVVPCVRHGLDAEDAMSCCRSSAVDWRTHDADCKYGRADALQAPLADHGISPAQLRDELQRVVDSERGHRCAACGEDHAQLCEKVEALEKQCARDVVVMRGLAAEFNANLSARLDAALKRINKLEQQIAAWRGTNHYVHRFDGQEPELDSPEHLPRTPAPIDSEDV